MKQYSNPEFEIVMLSEKEDVLTMSLQNTFEGFGEDNASGVWTW